MSYFLTDQKLNSNQTTEIKGEEARHILLSRRMKPGEKLKLQGADFKRFEAEVLKSGKDLLEVKILRETAVPKEPQVAISLYQSYVQEKALDFILQKSTELGASRIVLFNSANTATKLSADQFLSKSIRWQKILWEAAKQCDRARIPELVFLDGIDAVINDAKKLDKVLILDVAGAHLKSESLNLKSPPSCIGLVVGPEGGFTQLEVNHFQSIPESQLITLGNFILRAETAALAALAICQEICSVS